MSIEGPNISGEQSVGLEDGIAALEALLDGPEPSPEAPKTVEVSKQKFGASTAELLALGLPVNDGFWTSAQAFQEFLDEAGTLPEPEPIKQKANELQADRRPSLHPDDPKKKRAIQAVIERQKNGPKND